MLNGENVVAPGGRFGSRNPPPNEETSLKFVSNTSIRPWATLAAYRNVPDDVVPMASPVYTAPGVVATVTALVPAAWFHAEMVPLRLAKMNRAGSPLGSTKPVVLLNTCPVGPCGPDVVVGMLTVRGTFVAVLPSALLE